MAETTSRRRFNLNSWALNIGITLVVILSVFAMCQGSKVNATETTTPPASLAQNTLSTSPRNTSSTAGESLSPTDSTVDTQTSQPATEQQFVPTTQLPTTPNPTDPNATTPANITNNNDANSSHNTGGGPSPYSFRNFQSAPNPEPAPNPQFGSETNPDQQQQQLQDNRQLLDSNPYDDENRRLQTEEREQLDHERNQLDQENQESQQFQRDENGRLIEERRQDDDFYYPDQYPQEIYTQGIWPYEIAAYSQFLLQQYADPFIEAAPSYPYVADGIRHLATALFTLSEQNDTAPNSRSQYLDDINDLADQLQNNSTDFDASEITSNAFVQITSWMQQISDNSFPFSKAANEVRDVQEAARKIEGNRSLQDQQYEVRSFFSLAEIAVHAMVE